MTRSPTNEKFTIVWDTVGSSVRVAFVGSHGSEMLMKLPSSASQFLSDEAVYASCEATLKAALLALISQGWPSNT